MSSASHDPGHDHDAHDDAHDEPLPPDEPQTPFWFTALGGILFVAGGIFLVLQADAPVRKDSSAAAAAASASAPVAVAPPVRPQPLAFPRGAAGPDAAAVRH